MCNAQQHVETVGQNEAHTADLLGQEPGCGGEQHREHQHLLVVPAASLSQSVRSNNTFKRMRLRVGGCNNKQTSIQMMTTVPVI